MDLRPLFSSEVKDQLEAATYVVGILSALTVSAIYFVTRTIPWWRERSNQRILQRYLGLEAYSEQQLHRALRHYIIPKCQQIDPAGHEESRALGLVQEPLFDALARELERATEVRHLILLADSGMGKTSAVLNFCARHLKGRRRNQYKVRVVHLGSPDADQLIDTTADKRNTVLFLDALDEDTRAIENHSSRLATLLDAGRQFRSLVITCRTQFFARDEEIPRETGVIKSGPRAAGEGAEYIFHKLYLSPFSDQQVQTYLRRRYPIWRRRKRIRARSIVEQIPPLSARPMLLAHVDDLLQRNRNYRYSVELYDEMVWAWIERESGFVKDPQALLDFSKRLAVNLYVNREHRGAERIRSEEIAELASEWKINLTKWTLTGRSLLNRDAEGFYKFAHRSILEHLFVEAAIDGTDPVDSVKCRSVRWTDQMLRFLHERLETTKNRAWTPKPDLLTAQMIDFVGRTGSRHILVECLEAWLFNPIGRGTMSMRIYEKDDDGLVLLSTIGDPDRFPFTSATQTSLPAGSSERYFIKIHARDRYIRELVVQRMLDLHAAMGAKKIHVEGSLNLATVVAEY